MFINCHVLFNIKKCEFHSIVIGTWCTSQHLSKQYCSFLCWITVYNTLIDKSVYKGSEPWHCTLFPYIPHVPENSSLYLCIQWIFNFIILDFTYIFLKINYFRLVSRFTFFKCFMRKWNEHKDFNFISLVVRVREIQIVKTSVHINKILCTYIVHLRCQNITEEYIKYNKTAHFAKVIWVKTKY